MSAIAITHRGRNSRGARFFTHLQHSGQAGSVHQADGANISPSEKIKAGAVTQQSNSPSFNFTGSAMHLSGR